VELIGDQNGSYGGTVMKGKRKEKGKRAFRKINSGDSDTEKEREGKGGGA